MSSPRTPAPDPSARRRDLAAGLALLVGAVAVGAWVWSRSPAVPGREPPSPMVFDADLVRGADGAASVRLRVVGPAVVRVELTAPAGTEARLGPEQPVEVVPRGLPDPVSAMAWTHPGGTAVQEVRAFTSGLYVLHVAPTAVGPLHARITTAGWREGPTGR